MGKAVDGCLKTEEVGLMVSFEAVCITSSAPSVPPLVWNLTLDVCEITKCSDVIVSERKNIGGGGGGAGRFARRNGWEVIKSWCELCYT